MQRGFASGENIEYSMKAGITNIVFKKIRGSIKNIAKNKGVEIVGKVSHIMDKRYFGALSDIISG